MSGILQTLFLGAGAAIKDAYFNLVTLLLNTTATNGAQNNTFLDSSTNNFSITRNGNTTQGTFTPFSQTGWSNFGDGTTTNGLTSASSSAYSFGTGEWSLETWFYRAGDGASSGFLETIIDMRDSDVQGNGISIGTKSNGTIWAYDANLLTASGVFSNNTWNHLVYTRQSGALRIFVNGVLQAYNSSYTNNYTNTNCKFLRSSVSGYAFNGYVSNLRIIKGSVPSLYQTSATSTGTSVFTPPVAPLTAISGTSLLTAQSNRFVDNSTNNFALTTSGTPSVQAFSPFAPDAAYSTTLVGGSAYSGTTASTLSVNSQPLINVSDWTVEFWMYPTQYNNNGGLFGASNGGGTNPKLYFYVSGSNLQLTGYSGGFTTILANAYPALNQWTYVSVSRSSSTGNAYLYYNGVLQQTGSIAAITGITNPFNFFSDGEGASPGFYGYMSNARVSNTARYTGSSYSIPTALNVSDGSTILLTNFTNAGIYDAAAKNDLETVGNAQVSTTVAKWGTTSMYFDGTGDTLILPNSPIYDFGTGDFTIEGWVYVTSTSASRQTFIGRGVNSGASFHIALETTGNWIYYLSSNNSTWNIASAVNIGTNSLNTWQHIALVRNGTTFTPYLNGVAGTTTTSSSAIYWNSGTSNVNQITVGGTEASTQLLNGYIDDLRITRGYARYSGSTYTVPTAAFPIQ